MTKVDKMSGFEGDTITKIEKPLTPKQKLEKFRKENAPAIEKAREACCVCSPTRAELLLLDQADGLSEID
jgi:hypothetical protein